MHTFTRNSYQNRSRTAFTLIELLVVIAIIAILAAILFPVFARAKMSAKRTVDLAHVKQIGTANLIYVADHDSTFLSFPYADTWSTPSYSGRQKGPFWTDRIMPYVRSQTIFANSSNTDTVFYPRGYWVPGGKSAADTTSTPGHYRVTFAMNHLISHGDLDPDRPGAASESAIDRPGEIGLIGPQQQAFTFSSCQQESPGSQTMNFVWNISDPVAGYGFELWGNQKLKGGFFGGANFSFVDGHARFARAEDRGTAPGDLIGTQSRLLFLGTFQGVLTRAEISTNGTCPGFRGSMAF